jgi:hypothetical protein
MCRRLTDAELAEPNYELVIPEGATLPREVHEMLRLYMGLRVTNRRTGQQGIRYSIPGYLAREWLEKYPLP